MSDVEQLRHRMSFVPQLREIHTVDQLMLLAEPLLERRPEGVLVEAGCWQGVSTARLSHLADALGTVLVAFDSFQGLPQHAERHRRDIAGRSVRGWFLPGALAATLDQAQATVAEYGVPQQVEWRAGWFADTMPNFTQPVAGVWLDVDLAVSTRTCLDRLWPLLSPGGVIVSQDGHLPLVVDTIRARLAGAEPQPSSVEGLGTQQMVRITR